MVKPGQGRLASQGVTGPELIQYIGEVLRDTSVPISASQISERIRVRYGRDVSHRRIGAVIGSNTSWINRVRNGKPDKCWLYSINYNLVGVKPDYTSYLPSVNKVGRPRHDRMLSKLHPQVIWTRGGASDE